MAEDLVNVIGRKRSCLMSRRSRIDDKTATSVDGARRYRAVPMSSRQEEKERRRQERVERERAEAAKADNRRRLQLVGGVLLGLVAAAAVVVVLASGGGDDGGTKEAAASVPIPTRQIADLDEAVKAAGCTFKSYPSEGRTHLDSDQATFKGYKTNPPTSGTHRPTPAEDGIYEPGNEPVPENWVHTLEHGRVIFQYKPGTPKRRIDQLETLFNERVKGVAGYHTVLMQNNTNMDAAVAGVAWTKSVTCPEFSDKTFDVLRAFRDKYVDKGPELIP